MKPVENQPFFPSCSVKNVEIVAIDDISMEIRIHVHQKKIVSQLIFIKDVLGFSKEGN